MVENRRKRKYRRRRLRQEEVKGTLKLIVALKTQKSKEEIRRVLLRHPHLMAQFITQFCLSLK